MDQPLPQRLRHAGGKANAAALDEGAELDAPREFTRPSLRRLILQELLEPATLLPHDRPARLRQLIGRNREPARKIAQGWR